MRRLALIAAALLPLASGCVSSTPPEPAAGSVTIYWNFQSSDFQLAGDFTALNSGCLLAGVQEVDVAIYDPRYAAPVDFHSYFCQASNGVPGAVVALPPGSYSYVASAWRGRVRADQVEVFSTTGNFTVASGLDTPVDATLVVLSPQSLLVLYSKDGVVTCSGVGGVNYGVSDARGPLEAGTVNCDPYNELTVTNAFELGTSYTIDWLQLLDPTGTFSTNEVCSRAVYHNGFAVIVDLPATVAPGCR
jgi:hypothetical protein